MTPDDLPKLVTHFVSVPDPRAHNTRHPISSLLTIAICAVISGADTFTEIEHYGHAKHTWFEQFLALPYGIPSHDTFRRVFMILPATLWHERFASWTRSLLLPDTGAPTEVIAIDGKAARGSGSKDEPFTALRTISAWAAEHGLVLAQEQVPEGTNETRALPEFLALLELAGATVTIDAAGTHKDVAWVIREKKADYVLALKNNHPTLLEDAAWLFKEHTREGEPEWRITSEGHGRKEVREAWLLSDLAFLEVDHGDWRDLAGVGRVRATRTLRGETRVTDRYFLTSLTDVEALAHAVRAHWRIENGLHWVLDVVFREDQHRARTEHAQANLVTLRHLAVNLLKREPSVQGSIKSKRLRAAADNSYLLRVLNA